jgi:spore coat protein A
MVICGAGGPQAGGQPPTDSSSTWNYSFYGLADRWATAGGSFSAQPSDSAEGAGFGRPAVFSGSGLIEDVKAWIEHPDENHGWILVGDETQKATGLQFASREDADVSHQPTLTVSLFVPTGACCESTGTCEILTAHDCSTRGGSYNGDNSTCETQVCLAPYVDPLPIPQVAIPIRGRAGGAASYEISMKEFKQKLHRDLDPTTLWGYNGQYPGPTIEATANQPVQVRWINDLRRSDHYFQVDNRIHGPDVLGSAPRTVVHLHGAHVPPEYDGYPESTFVSGGSRLYRYPNTQRATMLWYHDHALGLTRYNVMLGLAGVYLLRDAEEKALPLPRGNYEIPLLVQDKTLNTDGSINYPAQWSEIPFMGDKVLVNGKIWPYLRVDRGKYRFRIVNGSNHRIFQFALSDGHTFYVIGSDGGLLNAPAPVTRFAMGPAERVDIVMDFADYAPGTEVLLENDDPGEAPESGARRVMKFIVTDQMGWTSPMPTTLSNVERISESQAVRTRSFLLKRTHDAMTGFKFRFGDQGWDEMTEFPVLGTTEIWAFANMTTETHPIHIHLVQFQILDRHTSFQTVGDSIAPAGERVPPGPEESGWKDTVKVPPGQMARVIMRFGPAGFLGNYVFHCHMLEHEDNDMMRQFTVVPPSNHAPRVATATAQPSLLWPPDLTMVPVNITGVTDSTGSPVTIHVTGVTQDEPVSRRAAGITSTMMTAATAAATTSAMDMANWSDDACVDARVVNGQLYLRRDRQDGGDGRVYRVKFAAVARDGSVSEGSVFVYVPSKNGARFAGNDGLRYDSMEGCLVQGTAMAMSHESPAAPKGFFTALGATHIEGGRALVNYTLAEGSEVSLAIYDVNGRRVANLDDVVRDPGAHRASISTGRLPRGIYFLRMHAAGKDYVTRLPNLSPTHG